MSADRFKFQRDQVAGALADLPGYVLNVGCLDDQAGYPQNSLKPLDPERVINCDISDVDELYNEIGGKPIVVGTRPNVAEVLFDCTIDPWPFDDDSCALVVFGDILEHLTEFEISIALLEARRVAARVAITVPEDHRGTNTPERADLYRKGHVHRSIVTHEFLAPLLEAAGWTVDDWQIVEYDDGTHWGEQTYGHFVAAH